MFLWMKICDQGSKTGNKAPSEGMHHSAEKKKMKTTGSKRKKTSNVDDRSVKPKKSRKLEYQEVESKTPGEKENGTFVTKEKIITKKKWKMTMNSRKDNQKPMTMKKRLGTQKNVGKHKVKKKSSATGTNWTETLDKKHEARRKRRAKGKVMIVEINKIK